MVKRDATWLEKNIWEYCCIDNDENMGMPLVETVSSSSHWVNDMLKKTQGYSNKGNAHNNKQLSWTIKQTRRVATHFKNKGNIFLACLGNGERDPLNTAAVCLSVLSVVFLSIIF